MKKLTKRILSALVCAPMLLGSLAACKPSDDDESEKIAAPVAERVTHVYGGSYISVPEKISLRSNNYTLSGDSLVFMATEILNEGDPETGEGYETRQILYTIPLNGGEAKITPIPQKMTADADHPRARPYINNIGIGADGSFAVYEYVYNPETQMKTNLLTAYAADGTELYSVDPEPLNQERSDPRASMRGGMEFPYEFYVQHMVMGENGTLYLVTETSILAIGRTGERLYEIPLTGYVESISPTADGRVLVAYRDYTNYENQLYYMDDEKKGFSAPIALPALTMRNYELHLGEGYEYFLQTDTGLYGLNAADTEPTLLCNWINSDINPNDIRTLMVIDADTFVYMGRDPATGETEFAIMKHIPDDQVPEKYLIRVGGTYFDYQFPGYVVKFNRSSDQYRITLQDYSEYNTAEDYAAGDKKLEEDILAGNEPDILYSSGYTGAFANYADKGVFADLYTLMENDPSFDKSVLLPCVLTPFETDGKLYQMASAFIISGFAGKTKNVGSLDGNWTIDSFLTAAADAEKNGKRFFSDLYREVMQEMLVTYNLASYIDYENASCNFNSETFVRVLEYLKSLPTQEEFREGYDYSDARLQNSADLRDDKLMLTEINLSAFSDYLQKKATMLLEDMTILGLPTPDGGKLALQGTATYSISANSPVQAGAWEFVKYMFSDEVQATGGRHSYNGFPATYAGIRALGAEEMKMYYVFDLDGSGWSGRGWDGVTVPDQEYDPEKELPGYLTQEDVDAFIKLLETKPFISNLNAGADEKLNTIIREELGSLYAGSSSAADTAKKIQSRVSIYLAEKS